MAQILKQHEGHGAQQEGQAVAGIAEHRLVEGLDQRAGRIWVESEGVGKGSTFCFTLPRAPAPKVLDPTDD